MAEEAIQSLPRAIQRLRFLVAEQNEALRKSLVDVLQSAGVGAVATASNGGEAWRIWQSHKKIDVFVCASNLPEMSGTEILTRMRADKKSSFQPAFILLASEQTDSAMRKAADLGADVFLPKPFPAAEFIPKVIAAVEAREQISGAHTFLRRSLEDELLRARLPVELVFDRYSTEVECEQLTQEKCVIRVTNNYGLGTQLNLRFLRPGKGGETHFKPIKGVVMKTERVPKEIGLFLLHVQFNNRARVEHGIPQLLHFGGAIPSSS